MRFSGYIVDLLSWHESCTVNDIKIMLSAHATEFYMETGHRYSNKALRPYIRRMVGKGLTAESRGEFTYYSYDKFTVTEDDLKALERLKVEREFPDNFDFDELEFDGDITEVK
jgi:hypothetical protein